MATVGHHFNRTGHPDLLSRCAGITGRVYIQSTDPGIIEHSVCLESFSILSVIYWDVLLSTQGLETLLLGC